MQTLSEIQAALISRGLQPKHHFGQNFLHDHAHVQKILNAAKIKEGEIVLEVGPGTGVLSEEILARGASLVAVEIDYDLEPVLREKLAPFGDRAILIIEDVLEGKHSINPVIFTALRTVQGTPSRPGSLESRKGGISQGQGFKLVANLPYNVATPVLVNMVLDHPEMTLAVAMVQKEVADRLVAPPGGKDYGAVGILIQSLCDVKRISKLSPGCFWPQPTVESAVITITPRKKPLTDDPHRLAHLLHKLFSHRRKQIKSSLGKAAKFPEGVSPTARPEELTVEQLVALSLLVDPETMA